ncbi:MAG: PilN domain-containing protein [Armatimonadetes bacterium]|nr:PilN domain-containing protein [Armatimonadota bacterium]
MAAKKRKTPGGIKLNLIPPYIAAARKAKNALILTVILCLLIIGGMGLWWQTNASEIVRLEDDLQRKTQEAQEVLNMQNKAQSIRQEIADISNALKVLDDIHQSGQEWANILEKISLWIPKEVRLTAINFEGTSTNAQSVVLMGYTTSVIRLRNFYSQLSQSALFTSVSIITADKNGIPVPVIGLPPVLPKEKPKAPEVTTELAPQGQPPSPGATPSAGTPAGPRMGGHGPGGMGGPSMGGPGMPGGPPAGPGMGGPPMGGPGMPGGPPAGPGMGGHGPGGMGGPPMGGPGMPGGPPAGPGMGGPPMGGPGMPGAAPMMGQGAPMGGFGAVQQQQIVRDPVAPRNAVYFAIRATLTRPIQVASTLQPPQPVQPAPMPGMGSGMPSGAPPSGSGGEEETSIGARRRQEEE